MRKGYRECANVACKNGRGDNSMMGNEEGSGKAGTGRGRDLDIGDFEGGGDGISIELDAPPSAPGRPPPSHPQPPPQQGYPSGHQQVPQAGPSSSGLLAAPPPSLSSGDFPQAPQSQGQMQVQAPPPRPAPPPKPRRPKRHELAPEVRMAMDVAEYGDPPEAFWQTPIYAARVLWRKHEIRNELLEARVSNRPDRVKMFEDALKVDDAASVKMGVLLSAGAFMLLVFLAALPVAIRFIKLALYG
jgi:hypothetical protein